MLCNLISGIKLLNLRLLQVFKESRIKVLLKDMTEQGLIESISIIWLD